ncbi:hypothetical protein X805_05000 [Sphaerotilus natans subsp. natans DSM 6575]|uniref:Bacteriophage tail tape measure C-terminal domain-containing protein n=1 Tax=Sphaerotilus natans subsp. natans DSM 6575 TaxID=1286631 RepID=A0A059KR90_9BURK|nr:phage tail tape measure C-terminal domain-containing protein [Sphaerotilus natans]KDB53946.1 hypothetical protein X805_05000 [Sphaerotilus natans subsp. natans DSM 6575]SIR67601.1 phage tail tape measure protein, lambda family [Sphaerotilus natans]
MTTDIKIRLTLDRSGYSQSVNQASAEAASMGRGISGAANSATRSLDGLRSGVRSVAVSLGDIAKGAVVFNSAAAGAQRLAEAMAAIPSKGIGFIAETEVAQLGMAGILQSMVEIEGQSISFAQAQDLAAGSVARLQRAAAETAASSEDLISTFRALLGPATAAGMSLQQIEQFTITGANAIKSMGMTTGQMVQELRDLTQGGITAAGSTLATALGLKDADIAKAKASSEGLFKFLMDRMSGFASTSQVYSQTLKGGWEALQEQITQASASAMAPAAEEAKRAISSISEALQGDGLKQGLSGIGEGLATSIRTMSEGVAIAREYSGAIGLVAGAYAALKIGQLAGEIQQTTQAKLGASAASRLAAAQAALEAVANDQVTQSSRQQLAALLAEQRAKVAALAQEQALTAARLRAAEAMAAQLVGQARLNALEQQVLPLRQQHAQQTAALEQAQQRLTAATNASSIAARGMGVVMGALGGPVGIAITAITMLIGKMMSARAEADKISKVQLSTDRMKADLAAGKQVSSTDASRLAAAQAEAEEKRDGLLAKVREGKYSMGDRSGSGFWGMGKSQVQQDRDDLAEAEKVVAEYTALNKQVQDAQAKAAGATPNINLRAGASSKGLDELLGDAKTAESVKKAGAEKLQQLEMQATRERELMLKRGATAKELAAFDALTAAGKSAIQRDTTLGLQELANKERKAALGPGATGENPEAAAARLEKAVADKRLAELKAASDLRLAQNETEQARLEAQHQAGLIGVEEFEARKTEIARERLQERIALIDAEIEAEAKRAPKDKAEQVARDTKIVQLRSDRAGAQADVDRLGITSQASAGARQLERDRETAARTVELWQTTQQRIDQLKQANASATTALITDPVAKARADAAAQVAEIQKLSSEQTRALQLQVELVADDGQREMLQQQIRTLAEETGRSVELVNRGLTERLKPGWQTMVEGWGDTQRMMREHSDQTMQSLLKGGEDAFVGLLQTGKLNVRSLIDSIAADFARVQFRQMVAGQGSSLLGSVGGLIGGLLGGVGSMGNAGAGNYSAAGLAAAFASAKGNVISAETAHAFALGAPFANKIVTAPTHFRFGAGGEKLGLMGEAGPEAIMPMPDGRGVQAISPDGRYLQTLGLGRDGNGRLSVVIPPGSKFATGGAFGASALTGGAAGHRGDTTITGGPISLTVSNDAQLLQHINKMMAAQQRDLIRRLEQAGVKI